jgi:isoquinoline 1-oxidoreductase beta subunit
MGKWSRRGFIAAGVVTGGALIVGVAIRPGHRAPKLAGLVTQDGEVLVNAWVKIAPDNTITVIVPHAEMGQGVHTTLPMMLADEMNADWSRVQMLEAPAHEEYANYPLGRGYILGNIEIPKALIGTVDGAFLKITQSMNLQITGGSTSLRMTGVHGMRVAGAAAREMLLDAAASTWQVPRGELEAKDSYITHAKSDRRAPFAEFAATAAEMTPPSKPQLKTPDQFTIMGTKRQRFDIPAKVDGSATFGIDIDLPNMRYATVQACPVFGGRVASLEASAAEALPGVHKVVNLGNAVAVIANGFWTAKQGLDRVKITWDNGAAGGVDQAAVYAQFANSLDHMGDGGHKDLELGDATRVLAAAAKVVEAEYRVPYLAHACMEPLNCTAWLHDGQCEIWTGTQNPLGFRADVAAALGLKDAQVKVHNQYLGGGFGRRAQSDYAIQAARLAQQTDGPVKLVWSREEDIRQDNYRPAVTSRFKAALDDAGRPIAWVNHFVDKHEPAEATHIPYAIANQSVRYVDSPTHVRFGPWRSVDHSQHGFFTESFVDELANAAKQDPYQFRRGLLADQPRYLKVLDTAAQQAGWGATMPKGWGRGIALYRSFGTLVAQVVDVEIVDGQVRVDRVVCAVDPGFAVSPDGLVAQMESGIIYGLTAALYGEISLENGAVKQSNFHDYKMLRIDETPRIETHVIVSGEAIGGAGEPGTPAIAPALANAIFAATGTRIRELPVMKHDLKFKIEERDEVV